MSAVAAATPAAPSPSAPSAAPVAAPVADVGSVQATESAPVVSAQSTTKPAEPAGLKVGGKTYSEAEIQAAINASSALQSRLEELSTRETAFNESLKQIKDPAKRRALLKAHDVDYVQEAEDVLLEHLNEQKLTPEQRELAELKAFKAEREKEATEAKAKAEEARISAQTQALTEAYEAQFIEAMQEAQLPRSPRVAMELLEIVQDCLARDIEISPKEAAMLLRSRVTEANRPMFDGMSVEQLQEALGPKAVEALIKHHTAGLQQAVAKAPDARPAKARATKPSEAKDEKEFWNRVTRGF